MLKEYLLHQINDLLSSFAEIERSQRAIAVGVDSGDGGAQRWAHLELFQIIFNF